MVNGNSAKKIDFKQALSWGLFDFANSPFAVIIISLVFPIYFKDVVAGNYGDFYWGMLVSLSTIAAAFVLPIIGAISDYDMKRKNRFMIFTVLSIAGTALLYFSGPGMLLTTAVIFVITKFFYELAIVSYDSFLLTVSSRETAGEISGIGWGLGAVGGIAAMLLLLPFYGSGYAGDLDATYRLTFPLTALFFLLFSIPAYFFIKEKLPSAKKMSAPCDLIKLGIKRAQTMLGEIKDNQPVALFLVAFYFLHEALTTLYVFIPIYLRNEFMLGFYDIFIIFIIIQLIGFPSAVLFGWLSDKLGSKKILLGTIAVWLFIIVLIYTTTSIEYLYVLAVLAGLVIGSSQAIARSWLSKIVPKGERSEFFGFNALSSKVAASAGPILFGIISVTVDQRTAMLCLLPFFLISFFLFWKIKE